MIEHYGIQVMDGTLIGQVGRDLQRSLGHPFSSDVGVGRILVGGAVVTFALVVQWFLFGRFVGDVPLDPTVEYTEAQLSLINRALVLSALAFLLLMAPVYGYLLRMLQQSLSPNHGSRPEGLRSLLKVGFKLSVVGTLFTFHPQVLTGAWVTELATTAATIVGPEVAYLLWIVVNLVFLAYVFPAVLTRFAWRRRLMDLLSFGWYWTTLAERRYAELALSIVLVQLVLYVVNLVIGSLNPAPAVGADVMVVLGWGPLLYVGSTITFYALVVQFHLIGENWSRVHRSRTYRHEKATEEGYAATPPERKLLHDPTMQRRLSAFASSPIRRSTAPDIARDRDDGPRAVSEDRLQTGADRARSGGDPVPVEPRTSTGSVPVPPARADSFVGSLRYPWRAEERIELLFVGGLLVLLSGFVLPAFVLLGYLVEVLRRTMLGSDEPPAFEDWSQLFADGLRGALVGLVYAAVFAIASYLLLASSAVAVLLLGGYDPTGLVVPVIAVLGLSFAYVVPAALAAFAEEGALGSAFALDALRTRVTDRSYAASWLVAVVVSSLAVALIELLLVTELGWLFVPFVAFYTIVSVARLVGHGCSTPSGVEVVTSEVSSERGAV